MRCVVSEDNHLDYNYGYDSSCDEQGDYDDPIMEVRLKLIAHDSIKASNYTAAQLGKSAG